MKHHNGSMRTILFLFSLILTYTSHAKSLENYNAVNVTTSSFTARWEKSDDIVKYHLSVAYDSGFTNKLAAYDELDVGDTTSYDVTLDMTNQTVYYRVQGEYADTSLTEFAPPATVLVPVEKFYLTFETDNFTNVDDQTGNSYSAWTGGTSTSGVKVIPETGACGWDNDGGGNSLTGNTVDTEYSDVGDAYLRFTAGKNIIFELPLTCNKVSYVVFMAKLAGNASGFSELEKQFFLEYSTDNGSNWQAENTFTLDSFFGSSTTLHKYAFNSAVNRDGNIPIKLRLRSNSKNIHIFDNLSIQSEVDNSDFSHFIVQRDFLLGNGAWKNNSYFNWGLANDLGDSSTFHSDLGLTNESNHPRRRIPSLVKTKGETLVAMYEFRPSSLFRDNSDPPNPIESWSITSFDGGRTWEQPVKVASFDQTIRGANGNAAYGTLVYDHINDRLIVTVKQGHTDYDYANKVSIMPKQGNKFHVVFSDDNGLTWSKPYDITTQVNSENNRTISPGPGNGIVTRDGVIVMPIYHTLSDGQQSGIIYSKDGGITWERGEGGTEPLTNEAQVVELDDGQILITCRKGSTHSTSGKRANYVTSDLGASWQPSPSNNLIHDIVCQASIQQVFSKRDGYDTTVLFYSSPADNNARERLTVRWSFDNGESWGQSPGNYVGAYRHSASQQLNALDLGSVSAAYSVMARFDDGSVGIFYEDPNGGNNTNSGIADQGICYFRAPYDTFTHLDKPEQLARPIIGSCKKTVSGELNSEIAFSIDDFNFTPIPNTDLSDYRLRIICARGYSTDNSSTLTITDATDTAISAKFYIAYTNGTDSFADDIDSELFSLPITLNKLEQQLPVRLKELNLTNMEVGESISYPLDLYFADQKGGTVTYTSQSEREEIATVAVDSNNSLTISAQALGTTTITLNANSGSSSDLITSFELTVDGSVGTTITFDQSEGFTDDLATKLLANSGYTSDNIVTDTNGNEWNFKRFMRASCAFVDGTTTGMSTNPNNTRGLAFYRNASGHPSFTLKPAKKLNSISFDMYAFFASSDITEGYTDDYSATGQSGAGANWSAIGFSPLDTANLTPSTSAGYHLDRKVELSYSVDDGVTWKTTANWYPVFATQNEKLNTRVDLSSIEVATDQDLMLKFSMSSSSYTTRLGTMLGRGITIDNMRLIYAEDTVTPVVGLTLSINSTALSWTIDEEIDVNKYIVERYENGQWVTYTTVVADNSSVYQVTVEEGYAYRLTVVDNSGHSQTFSPENENISVITVNLNKGWNLVSSPVEDSKMKQVWCWDGTTYYIGDAKPLEGFWVYTEQAKKVDFVGEVATETTQPLATGWNLLGPSENVKAPNLLIYSYEEIYQQMFNDYDLLLQGHGYWIFSLEETTIDL